MKKALFWILLFGLIIRLISINQSFWLDEATTALAAKMPLSELFNKFLPGDFHPPFYYLFIKVWTEFFGINEIALRAPSLIFAVAAIYVVYLIAKEINRKLPEIAALLLATSGLHIYYSQEARMYALTALLVSFLIYWFLKKKWLWFSLSLAVLGMTDYLALFIIPVFFISARKDRRKLLAGCLPLLLVFLFWLPVFMKQIASGASVAGSNWWAILGTGSFKNILLIPVKFMLGRISFDNKFIYGLIITGVGLFFGYLLFRSIRSIGSIRNLQILWLIVPSVLAVIISFRLPILSYFRLLFVLPAFYLLLAGGIQSLPKRWRSLFLVLVLLVNLTSSIIYLTDSRFHREDWRAAAAAIGSGKIIFPADSQKEALVYYGKGGQIIDAKDFMGGEQTVWLSRYVWQVFDPKDDVRYRVEDLGYEKTNEFSFNGVVFWQYENRN